eukprot:8906590-Pyramimonas_sp.AAC.1
MWTPPLGPLVELPMGTRGAAQRGCPACERSHWGFRWSSLCGHDALCWVGTPHASAAAGAF